MNVGILQPREAKGNLGGLSSEGGLYFQLTSGEASVLNWVVAAL